MTITELSIRRPILIIVFFLILLGAGIVSYTRLKYELLPSITTPIVTVFTAYPGASPKEVENAVTKKVEEVASTVSKIKRISSTSSENLSTVMIEFVDGADEQQALQDIQRTVSRIVPDLPSGVKTPAYERFSVSDLPVLRIGVTANLPDEELSRLLTNQVKPRLAQLNSVGRVVLLGNTDRELKVFVDDQRLKSYGLSILQVVEALRKGNLDVPVGTIKDTDASLGIRVSGKLNELETVERLVISQTSDGAEIRLSDVAQVVMGRKDVTLKNRLNRQPSVGLSIQKQSGTNAVEVARLVRAELTWLQAQYKAEKLTFQIAQDSSEFTIQAANAVYFDFFVAIGLVALVMLVFLHSLRNALIVMLAIPTSLVTAFIMMYVLDYSLNIMTLLAMSLVIGILVDDSIVVLENIYRHLEMGKDKASAALDGRNEIGFAAVSITLVDVVVFLPMAFVPGVVGGLVREFSVVIVVSTLTSLLVCFTLTPMIASRFAKLEHLNPKSLFGRVGLFFDRTIEGFTHWYASVLGWSLRHKLLTVAISIALLVGWLWLVTAGYVGGEFAPMTDKGELSLAVSLPAGTKLEETDRVVRTIEKRLTRVPEISRTFTSVGFQNNGLTELNGPEVAEISIVALPSTERKKSLRELAREVRELALAEPGIKARVNTIGLLGANGDPIIIQVLGNDRDSVLLAANRLLETTRTVKGIVTPRLSTELGKPEVEVVIDRGRLADLGLDIETVGFALRTAINGYDDLKYSTKTGEITLRIVLQTAERSQTATLQNLSFVNNRGQVIFLRQFAEVQLSSGPSVLERRNRNVSTSLLAGVVGRPVGDAGNDIKAAVARLQLPAGVQLTYEGDLELQDDSFGALGLALGTSLLLVYFIMVALYNNWAYPFVVLFSIPVAVVGALLALALTHNSLNVFSLFGLIMLIGLVAKNAILLVDRTNEARQEGHDLTEALLDAGRTRLRPILMTTLAMVIGMLPLALAKGAGAELNAPLAWVLIGGLSSSMFLTLLLVPVVYYSLIRLLERWSSRKPTNAAPSPAKRAVSTTTTMSVLLGLAATGVTIAQPQPLPLSLSDAERLVTEQNPEMLISRLEQRKAEEQLREARSGLYPQLSANGTYQHYIRPLVFFLPGNLLDPTASPEFRAVPASAKNAYNGSLDGALPIFNAETRQAIAVGKLRAKQADLDGQTLRQRKIVDLRRAYYGVLLAEAGHTLAAAGLTRQLANAEEGRNRLRQGFISETDTLQLYLNVENARNGVNKAHNSRSQARLALKTLLSWPDAQDFALTDSLTGQLVAVPAIGTATDTVVNLSASPALQRLQLGEQTALAAIKLEQARNRPRLTALCQYAALTQTDNFRFGNFFWVNTHYVGLQATVPLFSGFRVKARVAQATLEHQQASYQVQYARSNYQLEARTYANQLTDYRAQLATLRKNLTIGETLYSRVRERWQKGLVKLSELQDADLSLIQTRTSYIQTLYDYLITQNELNRVLGRLE